MAKLKEVVMSREVSETRHLVLIELRNTRFLVNCQHNLD